MSLRDGGFRSKQSPVSRGDIVPFGDCLPYGYDVATCARNDMQTASHKGIISLRRSPTGMLLQSPEGDVIRYTLRVHTWRRRSCPLRCTLGTAALRRAQSALLPSILDKVFEGEL